MMYNFIVKTIGRLALLIFRVKITYEAELPKDGAVILCGKHISAPDPFFAMACYGRPIHFMAKAEIFKFKPLAWLFRKMNAFPVHRGLHDKSSFETALAILSENKVLGIMPEGHRIRSIENMSLKTGAVNLALRSGAVMVPFGMYTENYIVRPFKKTCLRFGKPIRLEKITSEEIAKEKLQEITETVLKPELLRLSMKDYNFEG